MGNLKNNGSTVFVNGIGKHFIFFNYTVIENLHHGRVGGNAVSADGGIACYDASDSVFGEVFVF